MGHAVCLSVRVNRMSHFHCQYQASPQPTLILWWTLRHAGVKRHILRVADWKGPRAICRRHWHCAAAFRLHDCVFDMLSLICMC
jgi:hypothetical protein